MSDAHPTRDTPPPSGPGMAVVIPCFDEPDLLGTLDSLTRCLPPPCVTEVITVINHAADAPASIQIHNQQTWQAALEWTAGRSSSRLIFHVLYRPDLPPRHAGVGLARRIGMEWAMEGFLAQGRGDGVIVCLDADCRVERHYLMAIHDHFRAHPKSPGCSIHFEHVLEGLAPRHRLGIASYELSLRYVVQGWRHCGLPNAFHTVGSAMAVRAEAYRKQGGMNQRQAGEDFYFLQKIMALGNFTSLAETTVFPSARVSHRVPFGTGRAMATWMEESTEAYRVWNPRIFAQPRPFFASVESLYADREEIVGTAPCFARFLEHAGFPQRLQEMRRNTASPAAFRKRFFHWFDGFRFLKWAHWATAEGLEEMPVATAAMTLLEWSGVPVAPIQPDVEALLALYARLDRNPSAVYL